MFGIKSMKNNLAIFDLDGTLFDTSQVNYTSYFLALEFFGLKSNLFTYDYFCRHCNGNDYRIFLKSHFKDITNDLLNEIHIKKQIIYKNNLNLAKINDALFHLIRNIKYSYIIALATTASRLNTEDILNYFNVYDLFDIILTKEDVCETKPDPEVFFLAMRKSGIDKNHTIIFEDSESGLHAAKASGASFFKVF